MEKTKDPAGILEKIKGDVSSVAGHTILKLTSGSIVLSDDDVRKTVVMWDDEMANRFRTEILASTKSSEVTLKDTITPITGVNVSWGTDDTDYIQHALDYYIRVGRI